MPNATWTRIQNELLRLAIQDAQAPPVPGQPTRQDTFRRQKIAAVERANNGRPLIVYATACTVPRLIPSNFLMIDFSDKIGFKTVTENINSPAIDVLIHSPGGYPDAAESIVQQLRGKYADIRFIVPMFAKSAATMLVMSGNEILMEKDAELGPIDPQMITPNGASSAIAIKKQFEMAQAELSAPGGQAKLPSWVPILTLLGPSLLIDCQHAIDASTKLVKDWLTDYMFAGEADAAARADRIVAYLSDHSTFKSHGKPIKLGDLKSRGVNAKDLAANPALAAAVSELYCCLDALLGNTGTYKVFENSAGDALLRAQSIGLGPIPIPMPVPQQRPPLPN